MSVVELLSLNDSQRWLNMNTYRWMWIGSPPGYSHYRGRVIIVYKQASCAQTNIEKCISDALLARGSIDSIDCWGMELQIIEETPSNSITKRVEERHVNPFEINSLIHFDKRLKTFETWRNPNSPSTHDLAKAGFIFTGTEDKVMCTFCGLILHRWEPKDDPFEDHYKHNKNCSYLKMVWMPKNPPNQMLPGFGRIEADKPPVRHFSFFGDVTKNVAGTVGGTVGF